MVGTWFPRKRRCRECTASPEDVPTDNRGPIAQAARRRRDCRPRALPGQTGALQVSAPREGRGAVAGARRDGPLGEAIPSAHRQTVSRTRAPAERPVQTTGMIVAWRCPRTRRAVSRLKARLFAANASAADLCGLPSGVDRLYARKPVGVPAKQQGKDAPLGRFQPWRRRQDGARMRPWPNHCERTPLRCHSRVRGIAAAHQQGAQAGIGVGV